MWTNHIAGTHVLTSTPRDITGTPMYITHTLTNNITGTHMLTNHITGTQVLTNHTTGTHVFGERRSGAAHQRSACRNGIYPRRARHTLPWAGGRGGGGVGIRGRGSGMRVGVGGGRRRGGGGRGERREQGGGRRGVLQPSEIASRPACIYTEEVAAARVPAFTMMGACRTHSPLRCPSGTPFIPSSPLFYVRRLYVGSQGRGVGVGFARRRIFD